MRAAAGLLALVALPALAQDAADLTRQADAARTRATLIEARARAADARGRAALGRAAVAAARIATSEAALVRARDEVAAVRAARAVALARLAEARRPVAGLAAALGTLVRRPAALALVRPGSIADAVHVRIALDAARPVIAARTATLRAAVAERDRLDRRAVLALDRLHAARADLTRRHAALRAEAGTQAAAAAALRVEGNGEDDRVVAFTDRAREVDEAAAAARGAAARLSWLAPRPMPDPRRDPPRALRPSGWRLPVAGRLLAGFGGVGEDGTHARGIMVAPATGATARAPAAARVAWAGPVEGQGGVVILSHPGGWTTVLTGLARIAVREGDVLPAGAALGRVGARVGIELRLGLMPVDVAAMAARSALSLSSPAPIL